MPRSFVDLLRRAVGGAILLAAIACHAPRADRPAPDLAAAANVEQEQETAEQEQVESEILEKRRGGLLDGLTAAREVWEGTRLYWDQGPRLDTLDGDLAMVFGGRLHVDGATFDEDSELADDFGSTSSGVEVRRAFLELGAVYRERYEARLMLDVSGTGELSGLLNPDSDVDFRDVFVGVTQVPVVGSVRAGYFKEPFGLEEIESSNDITFMERSLTDALVDRRNLGVMIHGQLPRRRGTFSLGAYQEMDNDLNARDGYALTARTTLLPVYDEEGARLVHLGLAASLRDPSNDLLRFRSQPESNQGPVLVDTGFFQASSDLRLGFEAATVHGPFSLQGEAMLSAPDTGSGLGDTLFPALYVMGSWVLTGEQRLYRRNVGAFGRVHPEHGRGAWELVGRYSWLDLDSGAIQGGVLHDVTAGLNWYANSYSRLMFNYVASHPEGSGVLHVAQVRLQLNL